MPRPTGAGAPPAREERKRPREWHTARAFAQVVAGEGRGKAAVADVVIVCDLNAYRRGDAQAGEPCHIVDGGPIPVSLVRELAEDAFLKAVLHDGVNVQTVAHFGRHRPAALQTALDLGAAPGFEGVTCTDCDRKYHLAVGSRRPVRKRRRHLARQPDPAMPTLPHAKTERDRKHGLLRGRKSGKKERAP